ncbi:MAG: hypothetical protein ACI9SC_002322 [Gammaproteobacteria bacterium]|jgi:hypothetical protein
MFIRQDYPMENAVHFQEIIGTDNKKNSFFTVCRDPQQPGKLWVYFGFALLEIVEDDREHPTFKLLLARLYNAGLKVETLISAFDVPYTTLRRWAQVVKSGDVDQLMRMLAGRSHPRKLTREIKSFAKQRFRDIYPDNKYRYSQQIREEISEVFEVSISGECLRPLFNEWKSQRHKTTHIRPVTVDAECTDCSPQTPDQHDDRTDQNHQGVGIVDNVPASIQPLAEHNRKQAVILPLSQSAPTYQFCHHAGLLVFSGFLNQLKEALGEQGDWVKQWISMILLGAVNIEQSKLLGRDALRMLLGSVVTNLCQQRQTLGELATTDCLAKLLRLNGEWVGIDQCHDFYYDPHSKHYTGAHKILKGWCSRLRFAEKVLHMDFIHLTTGFPVYINHDDNFYDLRERFFEVVKAFRQLFGFDAQRPLTFTIDRGIFGLEVFNKINLDEAKTFFVTWEKGYQSQPTELMVWTGNLKLYKAKNTRNNRLCYAFQYLDERWPRDQRFRRIVVQASNPKGNSIQVSILTNHLERPAAELIELMFSRWLQENDFKYLDNHFGINEITSYGVIPYRDLEKTLEDRQVKSGMYKALQKQRMAINKQLKACLLREHRSKKDDTKRQQVIDDLTKKLDQIELEITQTDKETSRLSKLIEEGFLKQDTVKKQLMDGIKITARNLFYLQFQAFKEAYNNYRDDHVLFRHLTRAHGLIQQQGNKVDVLLLTESDFPPKVTLIVEDILDQLSKNQLMMPDDSGRTLKIQQLQTDQMVFAVKKSDTLDVSVFD